MSVLTCTILVCISVPNKQEQPESFESPSEIVCVSWSKGKTALQTFFLFIFE